MEEKNEIELNADDTNKVDYAAKLKDACDAMWWLFFSRTPTIYDPEILRNKRIVVSWSGGWDSTALLILMANRYGTTEKPVVAHVTKTTNINSEQQKQEQKCIDTLKTLLTEQYKLPITFTETTMDLGGHSIGVDDYSGLAQAVLNAFSPALYHGGSDTVVCYGYIYKDDFWSVKDDFLNCIHYYGRMFGNPNAQVAFPLYNTPKKEIKKFLRDLDLLEHTWYCEKPTDNGEPCGTCASCKRVQMIEFEEEFEKRKEEQEKIKLEELKK